MNRTRLLLASILILGGLGLSLTVYAQARDGGKKATPRALIQLSRRIPFILSSQGPPPTEEEYRQFVHSSIRVLISYPVLNDVVRKKIYANWNLDIEKLRSQLVVKEVENTDMVEVTITGYKAADGAALINDILDVYLLRSLNREKQQREIRFAQLKRLWESYQDDIKSKRERLRILADHSAQAPVQVELAKQRLTADTLEADRLELVQQAATSRVERLKAVKSPSEEELRSLRKNEEDLAVYTSQIKLLRTRIEKSAEQMRNSRSNEVDLDREQEEIALATESARKIGREVEALSIERDAASRIVVIESASAQE